VTVRFNELRSYTCPECRTILIWEQVKIFEQRRFVLGHGALGCVHDGKRFYAPGADLEQIPSDVLGECVSPLSGVAVNVTGALSPDDLNKVVASIKQRIKAK